MIVMLSFVKLYDVNGAEGGLEIKIINLAADNEENVLFFALN